MIEKHLVLSDLIIDLTFGFWHLDFNLIRRILIANKRVIATLLIASLMLTAFVGYMSRKNISLLADMALNQGEVKIFEQKPEHIMASADFGNVISENGEIKLDYLPSGLKKISNFEKTADLPEPREDGAGLYGDNNWIYQFGGLANAQNASNRIYRAKIDPISGEIIDPPSGELPNGFGQYKDPVEGTKWVEDETVIPYGPSLGHRAIMNNGWIYLIGGSNRATGQNYQEVTWTRVGSGFNETGALSGNWRQDPVSDIPEAFVDFGIAKYQEYIYIMGGLGYKDNVYYSKTSFSDGGLSVPEGKVGVPQTAWASASKSLPIPLARMQTVVLDNHLYVFGGVTSGGQSSARSFMISLDPENGDTVGDWQELAEFSNPIMPALAVSANGAVYVVSSGGTVFGGQVNPLDGKINRWEEISSVPITGGQNLNNASTATASGHAYMMGGLVTQSTKTVFNSTLNLGDPENEVANRWHETLELPKAGTYSTASHLNYLYAIGDGIVDENANRPKIEPFGKIYYAQVGEGGKIENRWQESSLPEQMKQEKGLLVATSSGHLYIFGGYSGYLIRDPYGNHDNNRVRTAESWVAKINQVTGELADWQKISANLPSTSTGNVRYTQGRFYAIDSSNQKVYYADSSPDGDIKIWNETTGLPKSLASIGAFIAGNYIYTVGGFVDGTQQSTDIVYYNLIKDGGGLGEWRVAGYLPSRQVYAYKPLVANGGIYLFAGEQGGNAGHDFGHYVRYADIKRDGTLGNWSWQEAAGLPITSYIQPSTIVTDNIYAYALGGFDHATYYDGNVQAYLDSYSSEVHLISLVGNSSSDRYFGPAGNLINTIDLGSDIAISRFIWDADTVSIGGSNGNGGGAETTPTIPIGRSIIDKAYAQQDSPSSLIVKIRTAKSNGDWGQWTRVLSGKEIKINDSIRYVQYDMSFAASQDQKTSPKISAVALTTGAGEDAVPGVPPSQGSAPWSGGLPSTGISIIMALILAALITISIYLFVKYQSADIGGYKSRPRKE